MFYVLYFNLFTLYLNIFFPMLYEVFIYVIGVERVHAGHVVNLCITRERYISHKLVRYVVPKLSSVF
jgi:hypothetical protein